MNKLVSLSMLVAAVLLLVGVVPAVASNTMLVQPDGRIVLGGAAMPNAAALVRYLPNGALDTSFGSGGIAIDRRLGGYSAIGLQPDGRILAGSPRRGKLIPEPSIGRYLANGKADATFGSDGLSVEPAAGEEGGWPTTILAQPGGRILVATNIWGSKYHPAGSAAVTAFAASGQFERTMLNLRSSSLGISTTINEILPGSGVAAGGMAVKPSSPNDAAQLLLRLQEATPAGYDPSFGAGEGLVAGPGGEALALTADQAGNIVTAGTSANSPYLPNAHGVLARYDANGVLDPGFGAGGRTDMILGGYSSLSFQAVALAPGGSIVAVGRAKRELISGVRCGSCEVAVVARFTPEGQLDPSFGSGGFVVLGSGAGFGAHPLPSMTGDDVAVLADGSVLVSGTATGESKAFVLSRLTPQGGLDPSFGNGGVVTTYTCKGKPGEALQTSCYTRPRVEFRVRGLRSPRPSLRLKVRPDPSRARIKWVQLVLPRGLRIYPNRIGKSGGLRCRAGKRIPEAKLSSRTIRLDDLGGVKWVSLSLWMGAFRATKRLDPSQKLAFQVRVLFDTEGEYQQTVTLDRRP